MVGNLSPGSLEALGVLVLAQLAGWELTVWVLGWDIAPRTERLRKGLPVGRGGKVGASGAAVGSGGPGGLLRAPREPPPSALTPSLLCPLKSQGGEAAGSREGRPGLPSASSTGFLGALGPVLVTETQEALLSAWCL